MYISIPAGVNRVLEKTIYGSQHLIPLPRQVVETHRSLPIPGLKPRLYHTPGLPSASSQRTTILFLSNRMLHHWYYLIRAILYRFLDILLTWASETRYQPLRHQRHAHSIYGQMTPYRC
jgi:hypothetical protein